MRRKKKCRDKSSITLQSNVTLVTRSEGTDIVTSDHKAEYEVILKPIADADLHSTV